MPPSDPSYLGVYFDGSMKGNRNAMRFVIGGPNSRFMVVNNCHLLNIIILLMELQAAWIGMTCARLRLGQRDL